jgi:hypothetical protein
MQSTPSPSGAPAARASDGAASRPRPGQVPRGDRAVLRLCFLSVPGPEELVPGGLRRLADLGLGAALALERSERERLGREGIAGLLRQAGAAALPLGFVAGAGVDELPGAASIGEQIEWIAAEAARIEEAGGIPVVLPIAALARRRAREEEYVECYRALVARLAGPVLVDWTGPAERPELQGYFPGQSFERVMALDPARVRGARFGLRDVAREARLRRALLAAGQLLFTSDRANLASLLLGANPGFETRAARIERTIDLGGRMVALGDFSHAILTGSSIRPEALAAALERLAADDVAGTLERLARTH